jgi:hypothetical protein
MSRPSLDARPTRDVANVVGDILGTTTKATTATPAIPPEPQPIQPADIQKRGTEKPKTVNTAQAAREKTSFAIRPAIKRRLTELKLDLRSSGLRVTEAEIVEKLIADADAGYLARRFRT